MPPRSREPAELELLPVMNLVTILIPMLLLGATFANLGIVESALPAINDERPVPSDPGLGLTVAISGQGFTVLGAESVLLPEGASADGPGVTVPCAAARCRRAEDYDFGELGRLLALVKDAFPDEETVVLTPAEDVAYEVLIGTMDATRGDDARPLFPQVSIAGGVPG